MSFFSKLERPREFKIETYYYDQNQPVDPKRRIQFKRIRHSKKVPRTNPVRLILAIALLVVVIYILQKQAKSLSNSTAPERIQVEEIIVVD
jgi:hypothetical protein